eukprot:SAG31_NODE_7767_length_1601_cov_1.908123_2_plen_95_part_00
MESESLGVWNDQRSRGFQPFPSSQLMRASASWQSMAIATQSTDLFDAQTGGCSRRRLLWGSLWLGTLLEVARLSSIMEDHMDDEFENDARLQVW